MTVILCATQRHYSFCTENLLFTDSEMHGLFTGWFHLDEMHVSENVDMKLKLKVKELGLRSL